VQLGKKLLSGHLNLINVSMPVKLFEPRSYLEKMTDIWVHPEFLRRAAESTDPVDRMQHVLTGCTLGPFPPALGCLGVDPRCQDGNFCRLKLKGFLMQSSDKRDLQDMATLLMDAAPLHGIYFYPPLPPSP